MDLFGDSNDLFNINDTFEKPPSPLDALHLENPDAAVAFISCSPDFEYNKLVTTISRAMAVPVVGLTSIANPFDVGTEPFGSAIAFVGKKNAARSIAVSDVLDQAKGPEQMTDLYNRCVDGLTGEPKLFMVFMPILQNLFADDYLLRLFELAGSVPVIGGMASDEFRSTRTAAFANDAAYLDRMVLMAFSGDVRPAIGVGCEITNPSSYSPVVTKADKNIIYSVDDMTFADYMSKLGFGPEATSDFPLSVRLRDPDAHDDEYPRVSSIVEINPSDGSGTLANYIQTGSAISVGYINKDNITNSARSAVARMKERMAALGGDGYRYDTMFAVSCVARYYTMHAQPNIEAEILAKELTDGMSGFGFFAFREIGPVPDGMGGFKNQRHGQSIVLCAI